MILQIASDFIFFASSEGKFYLSNAQNHQKES